MAPCIVLGDINFATEAKHTMEQLCMISNKEATIHCTATNCIPHESSISQQSGDMIHVHWSLGYNPWVQNYCNNTGAFQRSVAGMTSQIRLLWLISIGGWLHRLMARLED